MRVFVLQKKTIRIIDGVRNPEVPIGWGTYRGVWGLWKPPSKVGGPGKFSKMV